MKNIFLIIALMLIAITAKTQIHYDSAYYNLDTTIICNIDSTICDTIVDTVYTKLADPAMYVSDSIYYDTIDVTPYLVRIQASSFYILMGIEPKSYQDQKLNIWEIYTRAVILRGDTIWTTPYYVTRELDYNEQKKIWNSEVPGGCNIWSVHNRLYQ